MATLQRIRRGCLCVLSFSPPSSSPYGRCIFLPAGVKLFQDANGRFIRSTKREEGEGGKNGRGGRERGQSIERSALVRLQASGAALRSEYEVCYSETNPPYFENNNANVVRCKTFQSSALFSRVNKSIKFCKKIKFRNVWI